MSVDKVDQLINLVGELVITQAMLAQSSASLEPAAQLQLSAGLADLQRNTRDLQESVMSIRMIPMSAVFSRFPRMLRDLAGKLGKKVELVTQGEATELDKGMIEKITDPLTHLVRNSCDHGIEMPAERLARGKPETGTMTLAASHQGGSIVIEVRDDGKGLSRDKLLAKARERGLHAPDSLSDARGLGADLRAGLLHRRGGDRRLRPRRRHGRGQEEHRRARRRGRDRFGRRPRHERARAPAADAGHHGQHVGARGRRVLRAAAGRRWSSPSSSRPASSRPSAGGAQVIQVREEFLPVVELERVFDVQRRGGERERRGDGGDRSPTACASPLLVDELLGQQQVVVKNLESNYGPVRQRLRRHHHGRRPRGADPGRGRAGAPRAPLMSAHALQSTAAELSQADFERVRSMIHRHAGIALNPSKKTMVYSRLSRRLRVLGQSDFAGYLDALERSGSEQPEWQEFVNALTTNLTSFFREAHHFPVLAQHLRQRAAQAPLQIWCCAASTGEEPYTLAMTALDAFEPQAMPPLSILATDIDTARAGAARARACTRSTRWPSSTPRLLRRHFLRGSGASEGLVRVRPELRAMISFRQLNLLEPRWPLETRFDAIFCRNVMIYFDKPTQLRVLQRLAQRLKPDGLLFAGHSENFTQARELFELQGKTVYRLARPAPEAAPARRGKWPEMPVPRRSRRLLRRRINWCGRGR